MNYNPILSLQLFPGYWNLFAYKFYEIVFQEFIASDENKKNTW